MRKTQIITILLFAVVAVLYVGSKAYTRVVVDKQAPVITCDTESITVSVYDSEDALLKGVTAKDNRDGDLTDKVTVGSISKLISTNTAKVTYYVFDRADNMAVASRFVCYSDYEKPVISLTGSLIYAAGEGISVADKISAHDTIDGDISDRVHVSATDISENVEGSYHITVYVTNSLGDTAELKLPLTITTNGLKNGEILLTDYLIYIQKGAEFDPLIYLKGGINASGKSVELGAVNMSENVNEEVPGVYSVQYSSEAEDGSTMVGALVVIVEE